jgi:WD40 repeat protein
MSIYLAQWSARLKMFDDHRTTENNTNSKSLPLAGEVIIGRDSDCFLIIDLNRYPMVSRHHVKIVAVEGYSEIIWQIIDLNSANGTYLNGNRLWETQTLQSGDRIVLSKDGPEFLFECEAVPTPISSEPRQEVIAEPLQTNNTIEKVSSISPKLSESEIAYVAPLTQSVSISSTKVEQDSSRSLWDLASEDKIVILSGHQDLVRSLAFSSDKKYIVSGSADKTIKIWDLISRQESQTLTGHKLAVSAVAFSSDGKLLASGSADKTIKIWSLASGESIQQLTGHGTGVNAVVFRSDDKLLASGSADKTIKIWDLASGEVLQTFAGHKMGVNTVAFSPDNRILASGSADRTVKLWKVESGEVLSALPAFRSSINAIFFSPDGKILAISTDDKTIRLWSLKQEKEVRLLSGYNWQTGCLAVSLDGQMIACGSEDKTVKVWQP